MGVSQNIQTFNKPESPSQFEFYKYDQIPVGSYTGIPDINIPLHSLIVDDVKVPIILQYHAGGIRVNESGSAVGLGWNLNFGMITQSINDLDDLKDNEKKLLLYQESPFVSTFPAPNGQIYGNPAGDCPIFTAGLIKPINSVFIITNKYMPTDNLNGYCNTFNNDCYFEGPCNYDTEPDIFRVNFLNHSFKFIKKFTAPDKGKIIILNNDEGYKINYLDGKWEVTDSNGDKYVFGNKKMGSTSSTTISTAITSSPEHEGNSSSSPSLTSYWYLERIITNKNKNIYFEYLDQGPINSVSYSETFRKINWTTLNYVPGCFFYGWQGNANTGYNGTGNFYKKTTYSTSEPAMLISNIASTDGNIQFTYNDNLERGKKLESITQKNYNNLIVGKTDFNYQYFISSESGNTITQDNSNFNKLRLKLTSIKRLGENPYRFIYNNVALPKKNSTAVDFWGFYNGQVSNNSIAPNPSELGFPQYGNNGNKKAAHEKYCKAGILEQIIYPTGSITEYDYEINEFINDPYGPAIPSFDGTLNNLVKGFGLRLRSYSNHDKGVLQLKSLYKYTGGKSITPYRFYTFYSLDVGNFAQPFNQNWNGAVSDFYSTNGYQSNILGSYNAVGYDEVIKKDVSLTSVVNGYTKYFFQNERDSRPHPTLSSTSDVTKGMISLPSLQSISSTENGKVLSEEYYDKNNVKVLGKVFNYYTKSSSIHYGNAFLNFRDIVVQWCSNIWGYTTIPQHTVTYYAIYGKRSLLKSEKTTEYFNSGSTWKNTSYSYNSNNLLISLNTKNELNNIISSEERIYLSTAYLISKNRLNVPQSVRIKDVGKPLKVINYSYQEFGSMYLPSSISELPNGSPAPEYKKTINYDLYDEFGNVLQFRNNQNICTSVVWGYNKQYPIAVFENLNYSQLSGYINNLQIISNTGSETNLISALNSLRVVFPSANVTSYTYIPLVGVRTITDSRNYTTQYIYDLNNRLSKILDSEGNIISETRYNFRTN